MNVGSTKVSNMLCHICTKMSWLIYQLLSINFVVHCCCKLFPGFRPIWCIHLCATNWSFWRRRSEVHCECRYY